MQDFFPCLMNKHLMMVFGWHGIQGGDVVFIVGGTAMYSLSSAKPYNDNMPVPIHM